MSSATIPDDLTMSTTSVFDKLTNSLDGEKEALLRRLRELMLTEENQVDKNLNDCKARLSMMESEYLTAINQLKEEVMKESTSFLVAEESRQASYTPSGHYKIAPLHRDDLDFEANTPQEARLSYVPSNKNGKLSFKY